MTKLERIRWAIENAGDPHRWSHEAHGTPLKILIETAEDCLNGIEDGNLYSRLLTSTELEAHRIWSI